MNSGTQLLARIMFGRFCLMPHRRELFLEDRPLRLGSRAFDVLMALVEARGTVVSKDALFARVWPDQVVEENNLEVQISALRAMFGEERALIRTVFRRGYQFTGEVLSLAESTVSDVDATTALAEPQVARPPTNLAEPISELIGRNDDLPEVLRLAAVRRLVTLTGAGGIGKTRLALEAARSLLPEFANGVWLAELSPIVDPGHVSATVATALRLDLSGGDVSAKRVAQALANRRLLLVLDNCEHVIDAAAAMAEALLRIGSGVRIIATSREPLRTEGEQIYRVPPLAAPEPEAGDFWESGAVSLFLVRSRESGAQVFRDQRAAATIAMICRRLDGIPLAIELAAARVAALGIEELAVRLDHRLQLLTSGRRTALPRHQTLRATLDWSYELLPEAERFLLRRLAIFAGPFSLGEAGAIASAQQPTAPQVTEGISSLIAKSLIVAELEGVPPRYRMLDTTRAYAIEKLDESGDSQAVAQCHAEYYRDLFERAEKEWRVRPAAEWLGDYGWRIDNLRAALDWAFSPEGDTSIGVVLTAAAVPLWMQLSLLEECRGRVERALGAPRFAGDPGARHEMRLCAALGTMLLDTRADVSETGALWTKVAEFAERLDDAEYELRSLWGLWGNHIGRGNPRIALEAARRFAGVAEQRSDASDRTIGELMIGISQHYLGIQSVARRHFENVRAQHAHVIETPFNRFPTNPRVMAQVHLARTLWLQGFPEQALRAAETSVADSRAANHENSQCYALALAAFPIALFEGDLAAAEHYAALLHHHALRQSVTRWPAWGSGYQGVLAIVRGDIEAGSPLLRTGLNEKAKARFSTFHLIAFQTAEILGRAGRIDDALVMARAAIQPFDRNEESWRTAELLRVKGELLLLQGAEDVKAAAEDHFRKALDWARRQGALAWELRAAMSAARLLRDQGRSAAAKALLQPVFARFTEGFDTADLKAAMLLLKELH